MKENHLACYQRRRSKRSTDDQDTISPKRQKTSSELGGTSSQTQEDGDLISGCLYEICHGNLPPDAPVLLKAARIAVVSVKNLTYKIVSIRYTDAGSLRTFFSSGMWEIYPALHGKFVMKNELASKVLYRQIPTQEYNEKKHLVNFWLVNPESYQV